jgi:AraC-like DNA-binding protein
MVLVGPRLLCWRSCHRGAIHSSEAGEHWLLLNEQAGRLFSLLMDEAESEREERNSVCQNLLSALLTIMRREVRAGRYLHPGPMAMTENSAQTFGADPITQAREYMRAHLHQPLTISKVARQVGLSRTQLAARLRSETRQTFLEFLTYCRIEEAKLLLRDADWSIATVAESVGVKSPTYFQELFKRHVGSTPGQFRRQTRGKINTN